ncbi:MAG TPA: type II toxin-antitoxin system RelE/ParE family toxin [Candidatus Babeliales bacterium]|nr:type II toxin-antitoxin system RelE/ParE family toxin [Candidatus Babeliales bacterium]
MFRISYTDRALSDIDAIHAHIARDSLVRADAVVRRLLNVTRILRSAPRAGHRRPEYGPDIRTLAVYPFVVFYRLLDDDRIAQVVRVIDGRRDLGTVFFSPLVAQAA